MPILFPLSSLLDVTPLFNDALRLLPSFAWINPLQVKVTCPHYFACSHAMDLPDNDHNKIKKYLEKSLLLQELHMDIANPTSLD